MYLNLEAQAVKSASAGGAEQWFSPWVGGKWQLTQCFYKEIHGQRSLAGYSSRSQEHQTCDGDHHHKTRVPFISGKIRDP